MFCVVIVFLFFNTIIKCEDIGYIILNGEKINYDLAYIYTENESLNVTCSSTIRSALINISSNAFEPTIFATDVVYDSNKEVYMYLKLDASHHGKYIECRVSESYGPPYSRTRINLQYSYKNTDFGHQVTLDGLPAPFSKCHFTNDINEQKLCYEYKFYNNENVTIQKENSKEMRCDMQGPKIQQYMKPFQIPVGKKHGNCEIENPSSEIKNLTLKFTPIERDYNPVMNSLSFARILAMFPRNENTTSIIYDYFDNETIRLQCTNKRSDVFFNFYHDGLKLNLTHISYSLPPNIETNFKLQSSKHTATIRCIIPANNSNNFTSTITEVILIRRKVVKPEITTTSSTKKYDVTSPSTGIPKVTVTPQITPSVILTVTSRSEQKEGTTEKLVDDEESSSSSIAIIIGGSIGVVVFIIIIGVISFKMLKKKPTSAKTNATEMYAVPIPKSHRTKQGNNNSVNANASTDVNHANSQAANKNGAFSYAELAFKPGMNQRNWPAKPIPYTQFKHESPYAEPNCSESPYAEPNCSESPYAEPNCSKSPYAEPSCSESPYAETSSSESPYAELNTNGNPFPQLPQRYDNVFAQSKYANFNQNDSTGKEYVEPAYCEIMKNNIQK